MTNKTEMVRVPRELLERVVRLENSFADHRQSQHDLVKFLHSAPSEDVRAVVEEPFFYALCGPDGKPHYEELCVSSEPHHLEPVEEGVTVVPLYRHPQRPVVLPERLREVWLFLDGQGELDGCVFGEKPEGRHNFWWRKELREAIEAVEELNK